VTMPNSRPPYKPSPVPQVAQRKQPAGANGPMKRGPVAPPVYRPQPTPKVLQRKVIGPPAMPPKLGHPAVVQRAISRPLMSGAGPRFQAIQLASTKRTQSCSARLKLGSEWFDGSTGKGNGHAEMDALNNFIVAYGGVDGAVDKFSRIKVKRVECESRDVCKRCSRVLKALGFEPKDDNTSWGTDSMGATEWGCSLKVRDFLRDLGHDYDEMRK
jgi:hypothetical protein